MLAFNRADIVADPSAPDAFVEGIMEGVEWIWDNGLLKRVDLEYARDQINSVATKSSVPQKRDRKLGYPSLTSSLLVWVTLNR